MSCSVNIFHARACPLAGSFCRKDFCWAHLSPGVGTGNEGASSSLDSRAHSELSAWLFAVGIERAEEVDPQWDREA